MAFPDQMQDVFRPVRKTFSYPVLEQLGDGPVEAHHGITRRTGARLRSGLDQAWDFVAVQRGNDGCSHHPYGYSGSAELCDYFQAPTGCYGPRFKQLPQLLVQAGKRYADMNQIHLV